MWILGLGSMPATSVSGPSIAVKDLHGCGRFFDTSADYLSPTSDLLAARPRHLFQSS